MRREVNRRELLKSAAVIGTAGVVGAQAGCAQPQLPAASHASAAALAQSLDPAAVDAVLAGLERRLEWIDRQDLPEDVLPLSKLERGPTFDAESAHCAALVRKATRTLYATGRFIDMPDEMKAHPGVQAKLSSLHKDMDDAVLGMTEVLEQMTPADHRNVQRCLKEDPLFAERLAKYLEQPAIEDGLPFKRRFGLRGSILQLSSRMAAQSPALVTDPIVKKVRRIEARPRSEAEQLRLGAARMGEAAFWAHQERMASLQAAWVQRLGVTNAIAAPAAAPTTSPSPTRPAMEAEAHERLELNRKPGQSTIDTGAVVMGFGAGSVLLGLGFWGLAELTAVEAFIYPAVVLGVTVGPILLVVGLVVVLVGLTMKAAA